VGGRGPTVRTDDATRKAQESAVVRKGGGMRMKKEGGDEDLTWARVLTTRNE